jgi:hypothetical protein
VVVAVGAGAAAEEEEAVAEVAAVVEANGPCS